MGNSCREGGVGGDKGASETERVGRYSKFSADLQAQSRIWGGGRRKEEGEEAIAGMPPSHVAAAKQMPHASSPCKMWLPWREPCLIGYPYGHSSHMHVSLHRDNYVLASTAWCQNPCLAVSVPGACEASSIRQGQVVFYLYKGQRLRGHGNMDRRSTGDCRGGLDPGVGGLLPSAPHPPSTKGHQIRPKD